MVNGVMVSIRFCDGMSMRTASRYANLLLGRQPEPESRSSANMQLVVTSPLEGWNDVAHTRWYGHRQRCMRGEVAFASRLLASKLLFIASIS